MAFAFDGEPPFLLDFEDFCDFEPDDFFEELDFALELLDFPRLRRRRLEDEDEAVASSSPTLRLNCSLSDFAATADDFEDFEGLDDFEGLEDFDGFEVGSDVSPDEDESLVEERERILRELFPWVCELRLLPPLRVARFCWIRRL